MRLLRRRQPDAIMPLFAALAERLEAAQRALLAAIPTARDAGLPLAEAIGAFGEWLDQVETMMPAWREPRTEDVWARCEDALARSRTEAERLRLEPSPLGFEELNARVGDVLHPLEEFAEAERAIRRLRR